MNSSACSSVPSSSRSSVIAGPALAGVVLGVAVDVTVALVVSLICRCYIVAAPSLLQAVTGVVIIDGVVDVVGAPGVLRR